MINKSGLFFKMILVVVVSLSVAQGSYAQTIKVEGSAFARGIEKHEPVEPADIFPADVGRVYLWTKIAVEPVPTDIKHVWYHGDKKIAEVPLTIKYPRTRTYSYKTIPPDMSGQWKVEVVDSRGKVLDTLHLTIEPAQEIDRVEEPAPPEKNGTSEIQTGSPSNIDVEEVLKAGEASTEITGLAVEMKFGTGVEDRVIVGERDSFSSDVGRVYCWAEVQGAREPTRVIFVWYYNGGKLDAVSQQIKFKRHRTWTYKTIIPEWTGNWQVEIFDSAGKLLSRKEFSIQ